MGLLCRLSACSLRDVTRLARSRSLSESNVMSQRRTAPAATKPSAAFFGFGQRRDRIGSGEIARAEETGASKLFPQLTLPRREQKNRPKGRGGGGTGETIRKHRTGAYARSLRYQNTPRDADQAAAECRPKCRAPTNEEGRTPTGGDPRGGSP